jgi:hypothetical protein
MYQALIALTAVICVAGMLVAWLRFHDPFHPVFLLAPMFAFIYVYMPLRYLRSGELFTYVSEDRLIFVQTIVVLAAACLIGGCIAGSSDVAPAPEVVHYRRETLQNGAYILGIIGFLCWAYTIHAAGGIAEVFGRSYGAGWSDWGYIRDAVYLLIVALLLLFSPQAFEPRNKRWLLAVVVCSVPWFMQALLGARRGPTFVITVTLVMSWYLARNGRPPLTVMIGGGLALGCFMLILVANRDKIYIGSDLSQVQTDVSGVLDSGAANEYIFGAGCIITSRQTGHYFWGRRYLAEVLIRPIPHQFWPTKYADFGVGEITQNAGVAGGGLQEVMGWSEIPGAAAAAVADLWVEFSWLSIPVMAFIGWFYGRVWRRAVEQGAWWTSLYVILAMLSIYFVTQSGEAVIFRFVILTIPTRYIWRRAAVPVGAVVPLRAPVPQGS